MNKSQIKQLLEVKGKEQEELFDSSRKIREDNYEDLAFIRAIIEPSNNCRNSCQYCAMRKEDGSLRRYRMSPDEVLSIADQMIEKGVKVFSLETGEDPEIINTIIEATQRMKQRGCWILGAFGDLEEDDYKRLKDAGIDAYLLKFETSDADLFRKLRPSSTLQRRLKDLEVLKKLGFAIATGNIIGLPGQTLESLVEDIALVKSFEPFMATASPFISSPNTPTEKEKYGNIDLTLNTLAIYRQLLPNSHIPALCALNFYPNIGQLGALNAGANDVLINTARPESLAYNFAIYSKDKKCVSFEEGLDVIKRASLRFDPSQNYPIRV